MCIAYLLIIASFASPYGDWNSPFIDHNHFEINSWPMVNTVTTITILQFMVVFSINSSLTSLHANLRLGLSCVGVVCCWRRTGPGDNICKWMYFNHNLLPHQSTRFSQRYWAAIAWYSRFIIYCSCWFQKFSNKPNDRKFPSDGNKCFNRVFSLGFSRTGLILC